MPDRGLLGREKLGLCLWVARGGCVLSPGVLVLAPMSPFPALYGPDGTSHTQVTRKPPEFASLAQHGQGWGPCPLRRLTLELLC